MANARPRATSARSGCVQRGLLLRAGKRPGGLRAPLLAKREAQLLRRPQPVGAVGTERDARLREVQRTQTVATEVGVLALDLLRRCNLRHAPDPPLVACLPSTTHPSTRRRPAQGLAAGGFRT